MSDSVYLGSKEAAERLQMTARRVIGLCNEGKIEGAFREGRNWKIPEDSVQAMAAELKARKKCGKEKSQKLLPCAVGNTSYMEIARDCYYVDKTLLIRDLIDDHSAVTLFTRPRRFGKTLAINMLRTFFEKTDEDTSVYFRDKKIWKCGKRYRSLQGTYPVVFLTFKDVKFNTWKDSLEAVRLVLKDEYKRHTELAESDRLDADDRDYLNRMIKGALSEVEYTRALLCLTRMLEKHHGSKVIILIDEYDTLIQQGHNRGFYNEVITFMRNFLSGGLKDNDSLAFGVLTGILRVFKENLFSGLNNPTVNTVLDEKYSEYFGFTGEEVDAMAAYYGCSDKLGEIRTWYDGYRFGKTEIYNPWSVTNYFNNNCQPRAYWANTSDNEIIQEMMRGLTPEIAEELLLLMQGKTVQASLNMEVIYPRISDGPDTIFSFLLIAGYLKPVHEAVETEFGTFVELQLPNMEIRRVYNTEILSWLRGSMEGNAMSEIEKSLYLNDGDRLKTALQKYMISCISSFDGAAEGFYHGMVLGLVASMSSRYYIRSNRESGNGRFDLQMESKTRNLPGIIMEFKAAKAAEKDQLSELAADGLKQISDRLYDTDMQERGITDIVKYGIAFAGKDVEVKM